MNTDMPKIVADSKSQKRKTAPLVLSARVGELAPLVQKWMDANPRVNATHLVLDGLRLALKPYAGKRHAHLVES